MPIDLDESSIARVERYNIALAKAMGAPRGTHNIDRLLRLPGTLNWPNAKKRKNGRERCWARLLKSRQDRYRFGEFSALIAEQEARPQLKMERKCEPSSGEISGRWASLLHIKDPEPGGYASRSELSQAFILGCLKEGVSETTITSAMLDPRKAGRSIHEEAHRKGGEKHVTRQIARARDELSKSTPTEERRSLTYRRIDQFERRNVEWLFWPFTGPGSRGLYGSSGMPHRGRWARPTAGSAGSSSERVQSPDLPPLLRTRRTSSRSMPRSIALHMS